MGVCHIPFVHSVAGKGSIEVVFNGGMESGTHI